MGCGTRAAAGGQGVQAEVNALQEGMRKEQARSAALEKSLEVAFTELSRLAEQHSLLKSAVATDSASMLRGQETLADSLTQEQHARTHSSLSR